MSTNTQAIPDDIRKKAEAVTAVDQLRAFVERIERVEEEIKTLNDDKSDIYKEAAAIGFDKKALKKVVSRRKVDADQRQEEDALFGMYWDAIHGVGHVHARARENIEEFDAETGEILNDRRSYAGLNILTKHTEITASDGSPSVSPLAGSARAEESAVSHSSRPATLAGSGGDRSIPSPDAGGEKMDDRSNDDPGRSDETSAFYDAKSGQATTNSPETATQSLASGPCEAVSERTATQVEAVASAEAGVSGQPEMIPATSAESAADERDVEADGGAALVRTLPEHTADQAEGGDHEVATGSAMRAGLADPAANIGEGAANTALPDKPKYRLRPNCLDRSNCKSGTVDHCWSCKKAMAEKSEVAA